MSSKRCSGYVAEKVCRWRAAGTFQPIIRYASATAQVRSRQMNAVMAGRIQLKRAMKARGEKVEAVEIGKMANRLRVVVVTLAIARQAGEGRRGRRDQRADGT